MDPKWCQSVTQDGSFHGTEDGVCWNFGRLVPAHSNSYRDKAETRGSHLLWTHFGHQTYQKYTGLRPFKTVFVVILGLLKFVKNSPIEPLKTSYYCPIIISPDSCSVLACASQTSGKHLESLAFVDLGRLIKKAALVGRRSVGKRSADGRPQGAM